VPREAPAHAAPVAPAARDRADAVDRAAHARAVVGEADDRSREPVHRARRRVDRVGADEHGAGGDVGHGLVGGAGDGGPRVGVGGRELGPVEAGLEAWLKSR
jgi:hypothetical protein